MVVLSAASLINYFVTVKKPEVFNYHLGLIEQLFNGPDFDNFHLLIETDGTTFHLVSKSDKIHLLFCPLNQENGIKCDGFESNYFDNKDKGVHFEVKANLCWKEPGKKQKLIFLSLKLSTDSINKNFMVRNV